MESKQIIIKTEDWYRGVDEYNAQIKELAKQFATIPDCSTKDGYKEAQAALSTLTSVRTSVEKQRKKFKRPVLDFGKALDAEAKRIEGEILKIENPIRQAKEAEDQRVALIEQARIEEIKARIHNVDRYVSAARSKPLDEKRALLAKLEAAEVTEEKYAEFMEEADAAIRVGISRLKEMIATDEERIAMEELRKKQEAERLENERKIAEERRLLAEAQEKIDREREELEQRRREDDEKTKRWDNLYMADDGSRDIAETNTLPDMEKSYPVSTGSGPGEGQSFVPPGADPVDYVDEDAHLSIELVRKPNGMIGVIVDGSRVMQDDDLDRVTTKVVRLIEVWVEL